MVDEAYQFNHPLFETKNYAHGRWLQLKPTNKQTNIIVESDIMTIDNYLH